MDTIGMAKALQYNVGINISESSLDTAKHCISKFGFPYPKPTAMAKSGQWGFIWDLGWKSGHSHAFPFKNISIHIVLDTAGALFHGIRTSVFHIYVMLIGNRGKVCFGLSAMRKLWDFSIRTTCTQRGITASVSILLCPCDKIKLTGKYMSKWNQAHVFSHIIFSSRTQ